jgi:hypothetical protein
MNMPTPEQDRHVLKQPDRASHPQAISDDVIKKVTDKVYALLMQDLRIGRERHSPSSKGRAGRGGW